MEMTKRAVKGALNIQRDVQLAKRLGISRAAIAKWPEDEPIPAARQLQLILMYPRVFKVNGMAKERPCN